MNTFSVTGRLGKDPETRDFQSGSFVSQFSISDSYTEKGADGKYENKVRWHNCKAFNSKLIREYCKKGDTLAITGELTFEEWEDKQTGEKKSRPVVVVRNYEKLASAQPKDGQTAQTQAPAAEPVNNEDLPF